VADRLDTILAAAREALEDDRRATPGPWRFGMTDYGTRMIEDCRGYRFAQVDDDGNGHFAANARTREPALAAWVAAVAPAIERLRFVLSSGAASSGPVDDAIDALLAAAEGK
jgi:hypothetical protein